jgi:DNA polymerase I-like protein with 3'-5' exonuclease and polymerase domains
MGSIKLMPIVHPASMQAVWGNRYLIKHDLTMRLKASWETPDYAFEVRPTFPQVMARLEELTNRATFRHQEGTTLWLASDHETTINKFIACTGIAWDRTHAMCIPFVCEENKEGYWEEAEELAIILALRKLFTHPGVTLIGQSYLYDAQYSALYWQIVKAPDLDSRIMQHLLWPGMPQDLNFISALYCRYHKYWKDDLKDLYTKEGQTTGWIYNCRDCVATYECAEILHSLIESKGMLPHLEEEMEHVDMLLEMMIRGVKIDRVRRKEVAKELGAAITAYGDRIEPMLPHDLYARKPKASPWYRSPKQLMEVFYEVFLIKTIRDHKTKQPTTNDAALHKIKNDEPLLSPVITAIQEYRSVKKFSEFTEARLDSDWRMRCEYSPTTDAFRLRSKKNVFGNGANLQNLSKGHEEDE